MNLKRATLLIALGGGLCGPSVPKFAFEAGFVRSQRKPSGVAQAKRQAKKRRRTKA